MASNYFRPIILLTAIITLAQSIAWFILSLLGILAFRCHLPIPDGENNGGKYAQLLYYLYFQGECTTPFRIIGLNSTLRIRDAVYANPLYVHGWMCTYLVFNITYFLISISLLFDLCRSVNGSYSRSTIRFWCFNTLAFLIMDFWLTIVWGLEFQYINDFTKVIQPFIGNSFDWAISVPGMLMAVTARGFVLYVINFSLFCYLIRYALDWSFLFNRNCCQPIQSGSQERIHQYPSDAALRNAAYNYDNSIPRVPEPQRSRHPSQGQRSNPYRQEAVTSFDDRAPQWQDTPPSLEKRFRPSVHSQFNDYHDKKNFQRGQPKPNEFY